MCAAVVTVETCVCVHAARYVNQPESSTDFKRLLWHLPIGFMQICNGIHQCFPDSNLVGYESSNSGGVSCSSLYLYQLGVINLPV